MNNLYEILKNEEDKARKNLASYLGNNNNGFEQKIDAMYEIAEKFVDYLNELCINIDDKIKQYEEKIDDLGLEVERIGQEFKDL